MAGRIVLFGATGYTGELTARELAGRGERPVLAARNEARVRALADELGGLEWALADVGGAGGTASVRALVERGDVLLSTVGPFARWGAPAVEAAIDAGAHYVDSTGETPFIRDVFERYGPRAAAAGSALLTAMGYDWVPGNLAGALALRDAGPEAVRVRIGYFLTGGGGAGSMSGGTRASAAGVMLEPSFAWRGGRLVTERGGARGRSFALDGSARKGLSVGSTEHFGLPAAFPGLREVDVYLGWFGGATDAVRAFALGASLLGKVPGVRPALNELVARTVRGSSGGPDADARAASGATVVAEAQDAGGRTLASARLEGVNGYDFTAGMLAWSAHAAATGRVHGVGALGPVEAFGLDALVEGSRSAGIERV
ncbi:MAG TPA: saccharopine dehydrogenase NADP-binding domain-containing protein [Baekduia sp.]|uniref:saccharopine dehydrogenase family protein n=1 Tax=Baekduia sp. TaxID=2600305 RepID=UPI002BB99C6B|nr:saccharopine dehydrogenase NADP-binding domain-containing protein [Baekduia sp.]HMJ35935.1 saccharopine dehydrogenase NADP-binding domain-containing protein [Baekduia sp.]